MNGWYAEIIGQLAVRYRVRRAWAYRVYKEVIDLECKLGAIVVVVVVVVVILYCHDGPWPIRHNEYLLLTTPSHTHIQHSCKYVGLSWLSPKGNVGLGLYPHGPLTIDAHRLTDRYAALFPKAYPARRFGRVCVCVRQSKGLLGSGLWCRTFTLREASIYWFTSID